METCKRTSSCSALKKTCSNNSVSIMPSSSCLHHAKEYESPLMDWEEFTLRSCVVADEMDDDLILQASKESSTSSNEDSLTSCSSGEGGLLDDDDEDVILEVSHLVSTENVDVVFDDDDDDDDLSLSGESYIRSGQMSGPIEFELDEEGEAITGSAGATIAPRRRVVRFDTDVEGRVTCQEHESDAPISKGERKLVWYKKSDYKKFRRDNRQLARMARKKKVQFVKDFLKVYLACASSDALRALQAKHTQALAESKFRGSEPTMFLDILDRKKRLNQVLDFQRQTVACAIMNVEERLENLADFSRTVSKQARRLAHAMGSGDAVVARKYAQLTRQDIRVLSNLVTPASEAAPSDPSKDATAITRKEKRGKNKKTNRRYPRMEI